MIYPTIRSTIQKSVYKKDVYQICIFIPIENIFLLNVSFHKADNAAFRTIFF